MVVTDENGAADWTLRCSKCHTGHEEVEGEEVWQCECCGKMNAVNETHCAKPNPRVTAPVTCAHCEALVDEGMYIACPGCRRWFCDNCYDTGKGDGCHCHSVTAPVTGRKARLFAAINVAKQVRKASLDKLDLINDLIEVLHRDLRKEYADDQKRLHRLEQAVQRLENAGRRQEHSGD